MHIAICDDNIADRKQLERLLTRESDNRKSISGLFYADSFGDSAALLRKAIQYDLIFIDMTASEPDGFSLALSLIAHGISSPIVLCSSKIDYAQKINALSKPPANLLFLDKPIKKAELTAVLDHALILQSLREPTIELRGQTDTYYAKEDEIIYALQKNNYVHVYLTNDRTVTFLATIENFFEELSVYTHFVQLGSAALINITYLKEYSAFQVLLQNDITLKSTPFAVKHIKQALQNYKKECTS